MATLQDNWQTTPQDSEIPISTITKRCGAFTAGASYTPSQFDIKLYRENSPGTITCELYAADGSDFPTGSVLSSGTSNGDVMTTSSTGVWYTFAMSAYPLVSSTRYCLVVYAQNAQPNSIHWKRSTFGGASGYKIASYTGSWGSSISNTMFGFRYYSSGAPATNPTPSDAAGSQSTNLNQLSWTEGEGAVYEKVYFGETGSVVEVDSLNTTGVFSLSSYVPLKFGQEYTWRIDTVTDTGTITGNTWTFTTLTLNPPDPATFQQIKRLVACASNKFWYESI